MIYEVLNIWDGLDGAPKENIPLSVYVPENSPEINPNTKRKTVLICPGGGYRMTSDREAEPLALALAGQGFNAFVLRYSVAPNRYPTQLLEVSRALWLIRQNAEKWNVDTDNIAVMGFSAGGHLAASIGVLWNSSIVADTLKLPQDANKPNKLILCYPVISSDPEFAHRGSFENLLGEGLHQAEYDKLSLEKLVGEHTPETFLWHTFSDAGVPVDNSLVFARALKKYNIPFELHVYPDGPHGISLCDERTSKNAEQNNPYVSRWFDNLIAWLKK